MNPHKIVPISRLRIQLRAMADVWTRNRHKLYETDPTHPEITYLDGRVNAVHEIEKWLDAEFGLEPLHEPTD